MKAWLLNELLAPVARRVGGQGAAAAVGLGLAQQHEAAVAAAIAWAVLTVGELVASSRGRKKLVARVRRTGNPN